MVELFKLRNKGREKIVMEKIRRLIIILILLIIAVISTFSYAEEETNTITNSIDKNFIENQNNNIYEDNEEIKNEILNNKNNIIYENILSNNIIKDESNLELEKINSEKAPNIGTKTIEDGIYEIHSCIDDNKLLDVKEQSFNSGANIYISKKQCTKSKIWVYI